MPSTALLSLRALDVSGPSSRLLTGIELDIYPKTTVGILGSNGSGKSLLARVLAGQATIEDGIAGWSGLSVGGERLAADLDSPGRIGLVSIELQETLMATERRNDDTEFMDGLLDPGRSVEDLIRGGASSTAPDAAGEIRLAGLLARFSLGYAAGRGLRFLSTGEFRKTLLCRALFSQPALLILDDPYSGLDHAARSELAEALAGLHGQLAIVILSSRAEEIPAQCDAAFLLEAGRLTAAGAPEELKARYRRREDEESDGLSGFLEAVQAGAASAPAPGPVLVSMSGVAVSYYDTPVLREVNWQVREHEHWKITGPNGAGKSTLLSLINGDNPKAYGQDILLFGRKRGSGETVWEIKQRIGFVSGSFHLGYLVRQRVLGTVLSGFFDTVGLYDKPSPVQIEKAKNWCGRLGLAACEERYFEELSFGLQRSVLIARAMIKDPDILILDEPCQGLDDAHTEVVLSAVEYIAGRFHSTVLYVSHESEYDARLPSIRRRLDLVPHPAGGYTASIAPGWRERIFL